jgi:hypothetical protein
MFDGLHPITAEDFVPFLKDMPHSLVISIYCISRYHEKFRVTKWCMQELETRGFSKKDMAEFDEQFEGFYDQMLKQNDL